MSIQALTWVIYGVASDIKHADFRTLLVLADHADPQGMGAYPSRSTISRLTGYSVRTVSYALKSLESSGLISRGDQRIVSNLGGYKPTVWNLNMSRGAKTAPLKNAETPVQHDCTPAVQHDCTPAVQTDCTPAVQHDCTPAVQHDCTPAVQTDCTPAVQTDCTPAVQTGVQKTRTGVQTGVQHDCTRTISKEEPYIEPRESNARARKPIPIPADWKPSEEHRALADRLGIDCDIEADKFRDRALDSGARSADWNAKYRNWLVKGKERGFATPKDSNARRRFTWGSEEVKRVLGPISCEGTDTYMELACKVADLLNQGLDPNMLRRQLANVPDNVLAEQLFEQEAAA